MGKVRLHKLTHVCYRSGRIGPAHSVSSQHSSSSSSSTTGHRFKRAFSSGPACSSVARRQVATEMKFSFVPSTSQWWWWWWVYSHSKKGPGNHHHPARARPVPLRSVRRLRCRLSVPHHPIPNHSAGPSTHPPHTHTYIDTPIILRTSPAAHRDDGGGGGASLVAR